MSGVGDPSLDVAPPPTVVPARRGDLFRMVGVLAVEALCPLILLAILLDSTSRVEWINYQRDPAIYASIARFWQDGLIPYRDVWEFKPPLIFVALRAGFAVWGYEPESLRRVLMILTWLGAFSMYLGLRRARCLIAAPIASLGLMTLMVVNPWGLPWQNTEALVVAFGACAIGCAAAHQRDARWWWAVLTGTSLGLATAGKQPAALFAIPLGMQLGLWGMPVGWRARIWYVVQRALLGAIGFAIVVAAFALYFASHDALAAFYNAVFVDGARYSQDFSLAWLHPTTLAQRIPPGFKRFLTLSATFPFVDFGQMWPFAGAVGCLALLTVLRPSRWAATLWTWLAASSLAVLAGPYGENHYLVMSLPALALAVGIVCELCSTVVAPFRGGSDALRLVSGLVIAAILYGSAWRESYLPRRSQGPGVDVIEAEAQRLGLAIRAAARPGDRLFVGDEPLQIYLYAGVPPASRFIYWNAPNDNAIAERAEALRREPTFVFLTRAAEQDRQARLAHQPSEPDPLEQRYERWATSPVGVVFRRRSPE